MSETAVREAPNAPNAPDAPDTPVDWRLRARQLTGTLRLDLRRALLSPRSLAVYFLAFAPLVLVGIWALTPFPTQDLDGPQDGAKVFSVLFELYIRVSIFFSCLFLFVSLYRSEILERSLHYYLLTPVRRDVLAFGKYLAGLIAAVGVFSVGTTALFLTVMSPWGTTALVNYLFSGPGLGNLLAYLGTVLLACAGYGALFLLVGVLFRNPVLPAASIWVWESIIPAAAELPQALQRHLLPAVALPGAADARGLRADRQPGPGVGLDPRRDPVHRSRAGDRRLAGTSDGSGVRRGVGRRGAAA